jgi:hypothetical protein
MTQPTINVTFRIEPNKKESGENPSNDGGMNFCTLFYILMITKCADPCLLLKMLLLLSF